MDCNSGLIKNRIGISLLHSYLNSKVLSSKTGQKVSAIHLNERNTTEKKLHNFDCNSHILRLQCILENIQNQSFN